MDNSNKNRQIDTELLYLYGPRGLLLCGFSPKEQKIIIKLISDFSHLPVIVATAQEQGKTLNQILNLPDGHGRGKPSRMPKAIIMSGITEIELCEVMSTYRKILPKQPLWATLTPTSEKWTLKQLLHELVAEDAAYH